MEKLELKIYTINSFEYSVNIHYGIVEIVDELSNGVVVLKGVVGELEDVLDEYIFELYNSVEMVEEVGSIEDFINVYGGSYKEFILSN